MISPNCFTNDWISAKKDEIGAVDPGILEKSIHALALLDHLAGSGLDFVFKGGTSLLLHLSPIRRLSIDIDIVCGLPKNEFENVLAEISKLSPFNGFQEDERDHRRLPKRRHYRFFYTPIERGHPAPHVLLDVVEDAECNLPTIKKPITTNFLEIEEEVQVTIPTVEGLLADKLTAFAPNTIGVPIRSKKGGSQAMQVIKQLFDVGELFNAATNFSKVREAYNAAYEKEISYRDKKPDKEKVLNDTIATSFGLCGSGLRGFHKNNDIDLLKRGVQALANHLVGGAFRINTEAKVAAAKVGCIANLLKTDRIITGFSDIHFDQTNIEELKGVELIGEFSKLTRLKKGNPEAFYYWYKMQQLCGDFSNI